MTESDATKGPWTVTPWSSSFIQTPLTISAPDSQICDVTEVDRDPDGDFYTGFETRANDSLMSAAPELLKALQNLNEQLEADGYTGTTYGPLRHAAVVAISKALGEQP